MITDEALYRNKLIEQKKRTIIARKEKIQIQKILIDEFSKELKLLKKIEEIESGKDIQKLQNKIKALEKENKNLKRKYEALSKSKLGRLTLKYWGIKKGKKK